MKRIVSPLRYPGSKARLTELVAALMEQNLLVGSHIYEPFAGGASVTLALLANGFAPSATLIERDPMIYAFWKLVKERPQDLIDRMNAGKITLAAWKRMLPLREIKRPTKANLLDLGYAGLFFNRTCFSGIIGAGPIGGMSQSSAYKIDCRFNKKELATAIRACSTVMSSVELVFGDGVQYLRDECLTMPPHSLVYIDPPYVLNGHKLYRHHFDDADHVELADAVGELRVPWLLSYDNHASIRDLYSGEQAKFVKTYQSLQGARFMKEILLLSGDFQLPGSESHSLPRERRNKAELLDYNH